MIDEFMMYEDLSEHSGKVNSDSEYWKEWPTTLSKLGVTSITTKIKADMMFRNVTPDRVSQIIGDALANRTEECHQVVFDYYFCERIGEEPKNVDLIYRGEEGSAISIFAENPSNLAGMMKYYGNQLNTYQICAQMLELPLCWLRKERRPFTY
tara:strand:+ start:248 stop:706 length:459 start_codon:yes stop_codon:yes gene_type:complete